MAIIHATKAERRTAIIEAAGQVFSRDGYERARVDEIARRARVGKGTIYEHFGSKENLFCSYLAYLVHANVDALTEEVEGESDPRRAISRLVRGLIASIEHMVPVMGLFIEAWNLATTRTEIKDRVVTTFRELHEPFRDLVARIIRDGQRQGTFSGLRPRDAASLILATVDGLAYQSLFILDPSDLPRLSRQAERLILEGLDFRP